MLLPYRFKTPGFILILIGLILTVFYFTSDFRFELPVFAIFSSYFETKYLTTFRTNFSDELILLTLLTGFFMASFSREKVEDTILQNIRRRALAKSVFINTLILIFSILFIYGSGFMGILILNIYIPFLIYLPLFYFMKLKELKKKRESEPAG